MKKVFLSLLIVLMSWALVVSCDSNVNAVSNETVTVNFAASSTRSLSSSTSFVGVNDSSLTWFYKATPKEGAQFTHGAQSAWTLLGSLSNNIELSQGLWTFSLQARKGYSEGNEGIIIYQGATESEVLIRKQSTPVSVEIEVSPAIFGTGKIVFSNVEIEGIKTSETHRANKAVIGEQTFDLTDGSYTLNSIAAGNYSITVSYEVDDIVYGSETIDVTVFSGSTVTISGNISESSQSVTFNPSLNEEVATFPKQLSVDINTEDGTVSVSESKTIENGDLKVTYPVGTVITNANADATTNTADAETGFKYVSDTPSSSGITVSASESVAQYELTLNVAEDNNVLLTVEKQIARNLVIMKVLHNGTELAKTRASDGETAREYYSYNDETGKLTLYVFHASPIDIITADFDVDENDNYLISSLEDLIVFQKSVNEVGNTYAGKTVKLTADINLSGVTWNPIGQTGATRFEGIFDGQGYTISNMTVNNSSESENVSSGFFGWIEDHGQGIKVQNVKFSNASVTGSHYVGVVAGYLYGTINNCTVENSTVTGTNMNEEANGDKVGGIVGYVGEDAFVDNNTVENCSIRGNRDIGGIAGAIATGVDSFTYNKVSDTTLKYITDKEDYRSAGEIVSGRTGYTPNITNTATNVSVNKLILVSTLDELEDAVGNLHDGDYIAFGANIVQDKVDTTSGQITFAKASDATGPVEATLDLNGFVFDGQIGGFSFSNDDVKVIIHGTDKTVADYYEHETGHHMVKACALFLYSGSYEIKDGLFKSNNIVMMAYGGHTDIKGGIFEQTKNGGGVCIYACNDPSMTIDYAEMSCGTNDAIFFIEPFREDEGPVITINDGVYDASKAAVVFVVDETEGDADEVGSFIVNGGQFTLGEDTDLFQGLKTSRLEIRGGSFNVDPSEYVDTANYNVTSNGSTWTVTAK